MPTNVFQQYLEALRGDFTKLAKLEFLNPGGDVAFALDNNPLNKRSGAFLQSGSLSCNLQNGRRRQASVTLHNLDHAYEYAVEHIWFGQQIRLSEGLILPDGTEFYIPQGVFEIESPAEALKPGQRTVTYNLVDKWCNLDGTHFGNLEDVYSVTAGTNILAAVAALLKLDRFTAENNGDNPIDPVAPLFTNYYNDKTQTLTDGTVVSLIEAPYDFLSASTGTYADVVLGLAEMIAGDVGYNQTGRLVINPSQDDIADQNKPILWSFTENDKTFLGADYSPKPADVYNDVIVVGATGDDNLTPRGRAQNLDPTSDTCVNRIGRKTIRLEMPNYYSDTICEDYAMWQLKRYSTMSKAVTVTCTQMFHIVENQLITIQRQDKPGSPIERHVVQGFTRPIGQTGTMTINCISTEDYPQITKIVPPDPWAKNFVTFYSPSSFGLFVIGSVKLWDGVIQYSTDEATWYEWDGLSTITAGAQSTGYALYVRGVGNTQVTGPTVQSDSGAWHFTGSNISISGNINYLLDYKGEASPGISAFSRLFGWKDPGDTAIVDASNLVLPGPITQDCFGSMFGRCKGLIHPPKLPATVLADNCYNNMFFSCEALTEIPALNAVQLADNCYRQMFFLCSSIFISETKTGEYDKAYRLPTSGNGITGSDSLGNMFNYTGGTFTGTPTINTTYYTSNQVV